MPLNFWDRVVCSNVSLNDKTFYGIAGTAAFWAEISSIEELSEILKECKKRNLPWRIMGGGTNLLIQDGILEGVTLRLNRKRFGAIHFEENRCIVGAAYSTSQFVREGALQKKGSVAVLGGVPGTLGGAVSMNAGTAEGSIENLIVSVTGFDSQGNLKTFSRSDCGFNYRSSQLREYLIISMVLDLGQDDPDALEKIQKWIDNKMASQPYSVRSAGCMFKNPSGKSAGQLIESAGLKGCRVGDVEVSAVHANFLVNHGNGSFIDTQELIEKIKNKVFDIHKVKLVEEVVVWKTS